MVSHQELVHPHLFELQVRHLSFCHKFPHPHLSKLIFQPYHSRPSPPPHHPPTSLTIHLHPGGKHLFFSDDLNPSPPTPLPLTKYEPPTLSPHLFLQRKTFIVGFHSKIKNPDISRGGNVNHSHEGWGTTTTTRDIDIG